MAVSWELLFQTAGIEYRTSGNNVAAGNINIKCPYCRDDPSFHLGINQNNGAFGCWRDSTHRGRNPFKLLSFLVGGKRAKELLTQYATPNDKVVRQIVAPLAERPKVVSMDEPIRRIDENDKSAADYIAYLARRKITTRTAKDFHLHYALYGEFAKRVIIPAVSYEMEILHFTARTILSSSDALRYKTLQNDKAIIPPKEIIYGEHLLTKDTATLVVCEGVFDAMRLYELMPSFASPIAVATNSITKPQASRISKMFNMYECENVIVLLDNGAYGNALKIANDLSHLDARAARLPAGVSDPAELLDADWLFPKTAVSRAGIDPLTLGF